MTSLFDPIQIGDIALTNRVVMAPLTRNRAIAGNVAGPLTIEYYRQRASAGLIIAEATQISPIAQGYLDTPGIHSPEQIAGWRQVTDAVHAAGGKIVLQLWHVGRISHSSLLPDGAPPVSSTAKHSSAMTFTSEGFVPVSPARALRDDELPGLVDDYRRAARNAIAAGFDGVEVHAANTYLLEQFLRDSVNDRSGPYGGSIANRARLLLEVTDAAVGVWGAARVGVHLAPRGDAHDVGDSDRLATFSHVARELGRRGIAFIAARENTGPGRIGPQLKAAFGGTWVANEGLDAASANALLAAGEADAVAFGKLFIANPDLPRRFATGAPLNKPDPQTFYAPGAKGYTDYPALA